MNTSHTKRASTALCLLLTINTSTTTTDAFAFSPSGIHTAGLPPLPTTFHRADSTWSPSSVTALRATVGDKKDDDIDRLLSMAAKLRAEAASLEAEKAQERANAAEKAFRQFDTDKDGEIDINELKSGLEKVLKTELSDKRASELMKEFDSSGDGKLQLDEFVNIDQFRNRLGTLSQEERRLASEAQKTAKKEEEVAALAQARLDILNDREPTTTDRALSILPYLLPLLDGLQYGRFLLGAADDGSNPFIAALAIVYTLYNAVPFSGLIAFFALDFLSNNPRINRLVRYNMQQAIFLDIALFFPGLATGLIGLGLGAMKVELPQLAVQLGTDAIFVGVLLALGYCTVSSILGVVPDKVPLISGRVTQRMPSADMFTIDKDGNIQMIEKEGEEDDKNEN